MTNNKITTSQPAPGTERAPSGESIEDLEQAIYAKSRVFVPHSALEVILGMLADARRATAGNAAPTKPFAGPGAWFSVNVLGGPMREYAPGKWENAVWPSEIAGNAAAPGELPLDVEFKKLADSILQATTNGARLEALRSMAALFDRRIASTVGAAPVDVLSDGYEGGIATKNDAGPYVRLYYKTMAQAEAAFDVLLNMVDPSNTSPVGAERKAP